MYFPVYFEVIFAEISIMYVIPSEPADQRKERQRIFKISSLTVTFRLQALTHQKTALL